MRSASKAVLKTVVAVVAVGLGAGIWRGFTQDAQAAGSRGDAKVLTKVTAIPTCDVFKLGGSILVNGGVSEGASKRCDCVSDGAGSPAYKWCSQEHTHGATYNCTTGSPTVCP